MMPENCEMATDLARQTLSAVKKRIRVIKISTSRISAQKLNRTALNYMNEGQNVSYYQVRVLPLPARR
jgi:acyl-CoA thioesterase